MDPNSLLGAWTGTAHHSNEWEMKVTISILQPVEIGATLGVFDIPFLPCSGTFRVIDVRGETVNVKAEKLQGECIPASAEALELLPDGTLLYISKGDGWETRGVLQRSSQ